MAPGAAPAAPGDRGHSPARAAGRPGSGQGQRVRQGSGGVSPATTQAAPRRQSPVPAAASARGPATPAAPPAARQRDAGPERLDGLITRLLAVRGNRQGKYVLLKEDEVRFLITQCREILLSQPMLLELDGPIKVVGDIHGQYYDLFRVLEKGGLPPEANYLFLGDYVDRGKHSMEVICLVTAYKIRYPENFFLLRGNHESAAINRMYGFYDDCKRRYNIKLWKAFTDLFNCLPVAATVGEKILCVHAGISPDLEDLKQIVDLRRPTPGGDVPDAGVLCDLLWADPEFGIDGWQESDRGVSYLFGANEVTRFLNKMDMDLIIRAHQVMERGYEFFAERQLVTIFSAPNYCSEFDNDGAIMSIDEYLQCSFSIIPAVVKGPRTFL
eukprot:TRINITY_DN1164_c0_g1_i1.p1 TRINITY_DN1164_c0_g1~~TRINITY_DN1164_c0_g1_i1.p1  ORF type:complete len:425 (+),score=96.33 TRINITY_DN1164_c0_g1_i1:126-1277(+)